MPLSGDEDDHPAQQPIEISSDDDSDVEEAIQELMEAMEPRPGDPCIDYAHPNPWNNRWPDERTSEAHHYLHDQINAHDEETRRIRRILDKQISLRQERLPIREDWNTDTCLPICQHYRAQKECRILDLMINATEQMAQASDKYASALREINDCLNIRTYHQKYFNEPLLRGPLPIPDTYMAPPAELSDSSTDPPSLTDPADESSNASADPVFDIPE